MTAALAAARLAAAMRLASPALPIGGFSYSQGLASAIDRGWLRNEAEVHDWLADLLAHNLARFEAPLCFALCRAVADDDEAEAARLHALHLASRETAELRAETLQMGYSLLRMLAGLPGGDSGTVRDLHGCTLPLAWARAARAFGLPPEDALVAWLFAWLENQVAAAIKAVPLGQQAGQRLLSALQPVLAEAAATAQDLPEDAWSNFATGFALASSWHETQYSRLFRS